MLSRVLFVAGFLAAGGGLFAVAPLRPTAPVSADHARQMAEGRELFTQQIAPALRASCLKCHGDGKTRGGLDLATRDSLLKGGDNGAVVTPGKGKASRLYRLAARLDEPHMPPKDGTPLTPSQLAALARWIDLGAPYAQPLLERPNSKPKTLIVTAADRDFWSFRALQRPGLPTVKPGAVVRNPIDRFHLAKLAERNLTPSAEASRRTLIRRAYFDVVGLPPTPEEIEAFVTDRRPDAYERMVDRLLASPGYGERWARHWLDLVRFAESHGFEHDYDRPHAWPYRDFVIRALNLDLPYSLFVAWQLAGDEFDPNNPLALMATGFLGAGVHSTQITANTVEKERYDELDDIVRTMGTAMLGLTIGCARCHDHKYDPIPVADYYRLVSTFTTTVRSEQDLSLDPDAAARALALHQAEIARRAAALTQFERDVLPGRLATWLANRKKGEALSPWSVLEPTSSKSAGGATFTAQPDGSLLVSGKNANTDTYTFTLETTARDIRALRLEALAHSSLVRGGPGRASNGNFALSDVKLTAAPLKAAGKATPVKLSRARATFEQKGLPVAATIDNDPRSAWAVDPQFGKDHSAVFEFASPVDVEGGVRLTLTLRFNNNTGHSIGRPRLAISNTASAPATVGDGVPPEVRAALLRLEQHEAKPTAAEQTALLSWYRQRDTETRKLLDELAALKAKGPNLAKFKAMICSEGLPAVRLHTQGGDFLPHTHFLKRGDPNQKDGIATQSFPQVLMRSSDGEKRWQMTPPAGWRTSYQRRSLANWITDHEHGAGHLLARVMANRLWQYHFGRGIVGTPSDFGLQGDRPTHPELLDWLASELIAQEWRLKPIHRLILTSAAYRQGNEIDRNNQATDPENRFLWRRAPRRLEAESIRDSLLAVSDRLDRRMFGSGTLDPNMPRRSVYFFIKRSQLNPMMTLFDAPDGTVGIEARTTTTIAPQALLLLNNPVVRSAARGLGERMGGVSAESVRRGYLVALGRGPTELELREGLAFLQEQRAAYAAEGKPDAATLALTDFAQVLLGLNEFVYVD